jgi:hypothetical protein
MGGVCMAVSKKSKNRLSGFVGQFVFSVTQTRQSFAFSAIPLVYFGSPAKLLVWTNPFQ